MRTSRTTSGGRIAGLIPHSSQTISLGSFFLSRFSPPMAINSSFGCLSLSLIRSISQRQSHCCWFRLGRYSPFLLDSVLVKGCRAESSERPFSFWRNYASCTPVCRAPLPPRFSCSACGPCSRSVRPRSGVPCSWLFSSTRVAANLGLCAAIVLALRVWQDWQERQLPERRLALVGLGCLALVVLGLAYLRPFPPELGRTVTFAEAYAMPEFWPGGRSHFFNPDPWHFYFSKRNGLGIDPWVALLLSGLLIAAWRFLPGVIGREAWALAGVSIGLFISAHLTLFVLHYPNRYTLYALPVCGLLALAGVSWRLWKRLCRCT